MSVLIYMLLGFFSVLAVIGILLLLLFLMHRFHRFRQKRKHSNRLRELARKALKKLVPHTLGSHDKEVLSGCDQCAVCIEVYRSSDVVRILPCRHIFHKKCIDPWLIERRSCPLCKSDILKSFGIIPDVPYCPSESSGYTSSTSSITVLPYRQSHRPNSWIFRLLFTVIGYPRGPPVRPYSSSYLSRPSAGSWCNHRCLASVETSCVNKQPRFACCSVHARRKNLSYLQWLCCCSFTRSKYACADLELQENLHSDRLCDLHASLLGVSSMPPAVQLACYASYSRALNSDWIRLSDGTTPISEQPPQYSKSQKSYDRILQYIKDAVCRKRSFSFRNFRTVIRKRAISVPKTQSVELSSIKLKPPDANCDVHDKTLDANRYATMESNQITHTNAADVPGRLVDMATSRSSTRQFDMDNCPLQFGNQRTNPMTSQQNAGTINVSLDHIPYENQESPVFPHDISSETNPALRESIASSSTDSITHPANPPDNTVGEIAAGVNFHDTRSSPLAVHIPVNDIQCGLLANHSSDITEQPPPPPYYEAAPSMNRFNILQSTHSQNAIYSPFCPMCRAEREHQVSSSRYANPIRYCPSSRIRANRRRFRNRPNYSQCKIQSFEIHRRSPHSSTSESVEANLNEDVGVTHLLHGVQVIVEPPEVQYHHGPSSSDSNASSIKNSKSCNHIDQELDSERLSDTSNTEIVTAL